MRLPTKAMGIECKIMPALDGDGVVATGYRSSKLNKEEFSGQSNSSTNTASRTASISMVKPHEQSKNHQVSSGRD